MPEFDKSTNRARWTQARAGAGTILACSLLTIMTCTGRASSPSGMGSAAAGTPAKEVKTYAVNRTVSSFPAGEDMSTPEAAYAAIDRAMAGGDEAAWARLSIARLAGEFPKDAKPVAVPAEIAAGWLNAKILEVDMSNGNRAMVCAEVSMKGRRFIDLRSLDLENGRWLNAGNDSARTLEDARAHFRRNCARREVEEMLASRPAVADPVGYLRPFVDFLRAEAADPIEFLTKAVAGHRLVILGELHHRPRYWAFAEELVRRPEFSRKAGVIYMELPSNGQPLIDRFLAAPDYDPTPVIEMLRDMMWMGWPDQAMLEFFETVWRANLTLSPGSRLRIVLVDMARPWKEIKVREDWRKYEVDRDLCMAGNIERDLAAHETDPRHALFIVGYMHAPADLVIAGDGSLKSAARHLREKLGKRNVFTVFPHSPVTSNNGELKGRIALGLFETAFAGLGNRPMAFPLDNGPFGEQVFDASPDFPTADPFRRGYDAYLYLGPLEDEIFSPLIPGFYTDEFVAELDRRCRVTFGKGLVEGEGLEKADAEHFIRWMSKGWGQPRREWRALGPLDVWETGNGGTEGTSGTGTDGRKN
jgi:hypothetical protein